MKNKRGNEKVINEADLRDWMSSHTHDCMIHPGV